MGFVWNYLRNLATGRMGRQPWRPLLFSYYVTHRCPLNCSYCCDGSGVPFKANAIPELGLPEIKRLLQCLRPAGDALDITGGEPLVREDLEDILALARELGFRTVLNTKGLGLADRPDVLDLTDVLVLSVDALTPHRLSAIIGGCEGAAERLLDSLQWILSRKREVTTRIVLSAVAMPGHLDAVGEVLKFAIDNGLGFQLSPEIVGTAVNASLRGDNQYRELIDATFRLKSERKRVLGVPEYLLGIRDFRAFRCYPLLMPTIRPDGRMYYPCLESGEAPIDLLQYESYWRAIADARARFGEPPSCGDRCHLFCHMALSMLQQHPVSALGELRQWRN
jgi:MoaA/NifB/PqqE/SkfB family radical SAM enzyme